MDSAQLLTNTEVLLKWDGEINGYLINLRETLINPNMTDKITVITGSVAEGCSTAKWFHPDPEKHEIEIDVQHIAANFLQEDEKLFELIPGKPDNVKIKVDRNVLIKRCHPKMFDIMNEMITNNYLNPKIVRESGHNIVKFRDGDGTTKTVICSMFDISKYDLTPDHTETIKGTAITLKIMAWNRQNDVIARASVDNVPAFRCAFWPQPAIDFVNRASLVNPQRKPHWPSQEIRESIQSSGCDIVPKSSGGPDSDPTTEFRWSFSRAETRLMNSLSHQQKRSYFLAKVIFYRHVKPIDSDAIHSYWAKTTMLWLCEEYNPSHPIWQDQNLVPSVRLFFVELLSKVEKWNIPHYFVQSHSLLRYTDESLKPQLEERIRSIVNNIDKYLPPDSEFREVFRLLSPQREAIGKASNLATIVKDLFLPLLRTCIYSEDP